MQITWNAKVDTRKHRENTIAVTKMFKSYLLSVACALFLSVSANEYAYLEEASSANEYTFSKLCAPVVAELFHGSTLLGSGAFGSAYQIKQPESCV